jgi:SP family facilitated glucose transporter-like MFS transporter 8
MLGGFTLGLSIGWSSPVEYIVGEIIKTNSTLPDTKKMAQAIVDENFFLIASMLALGAMCAMFPVAFALDRLGRKVTMLGVTPLLCISFLIVGITFDTYAWMAGRFIMGYASATIGIVSPIYVGEIAEHDIRGALGVYFQLCLVCGIATEYSLGLIGDWRVLGYVSAIFPLIFFALFILMPETPTFLLIKGKREFAVKSLQWYRGKNCNISKEMSELEEAAEQMKSMEMSYKDLFKTVAARKSLIIALGLLIFQQVSGINVVMFYSSSVFKSTGSALTPIHSAIVLAVVQIAGTLISTLIVDRYGRKLLLYVSHVGMGVFLYAIGCWYMYLDSSTSEISNAIESIPILIFCLYLIFFSLGCGPIPWTMVGEIFPKELKGMCGSIAGFVNWGFVFIITVTFSKFKDATPSYVPYFTYALFCFTANVFFYFVVIETKGKKLEEIQRELQN